MAKAAARTTAPKRQPYDLFDPMAVFTTEEIAITLRVSATAVRSWLREGKLDPEGIVDLPRGRRVYGWALNQFVRDRRG